LKEQQEEQMEEQEQQDEGGVAKRHATTIKLSKTSLPPPDTGKVNRAKVVNGA